MRNLLLMHRFYALTFSNRSPRNARRQERRRADAAMGCHGQGMALHIQWRAPFSLWLVSSACANGACFDDLLLSDIPDAMGMPVR